MSTLQYLPNELITHILSYLDTPSVLEPLFRENAATFLDEYYEARMPDISSDNSDGESESNENRPYKYCAPLKAASCINRRWRHATLPYLFRYAIWTFKRLEQPDVDDEAASGVAEEQLPEFLRFLRNNDLGRCMDGLTIHVKYPKKFVGKDRKHVGRYGILPSTKWQASSQCADSETSGAVVPADTVGHSTWDNTWFWKMLLSELDPLRISLVSSPAILATMLSRKIFVNTAAAFRMRHHIISVSRESRDSSSTFNARDMKESLEQASKDGTRARERRYSAPPCDNLPCELFSLRPWKTLFVNEGSSLPVYSTEIYGDMPPSPFLSIMCSEDPSTVYMLTETLRVLTYVAILPMATHIQASIYKLAPPKLEQLNMQIMPRDIDTREFLYDGVDMEDIISERDNVYALLFASIFIPVPDPIWAPLRVFETADTSDEVAWGEAVETVKSSRSYWDVVAEGRLVKNLIREKEGKPNGHGNGQPGVLETFNEAMW
jgi:hypothetical protein